jgi:hypothetical protein
LTILTCTVVPSLAGLATASASNSPFTDVAVELVAETVENTPVAQELFLQNVTVAPDKESGVTARCAVTST